MREPINVVHKDWLKDNQVMIDDKFYRTLTIREDGQKMLIPEAATSSIIKEWHDNPETKPPTYVQNPDGTVLPLLSGQEFIKEAMKSSTTEPRITPKLENLLRVTRLSKGDVVAANMEPYMRDNRHSFDSDFMFSNQNSYFKVIESDNLYAVYDPKYATFNVLNDTAVAHDLSGADILTYDEILAKYPEMITNTEVLLDMKYGETLIMNTNSSEYDIVIQNTFADDFAVSADKGADTVYFGSALKFDGSLPIIDRGFPDPELSSIKCRKLNSVQYSDLAGCTVGAPTATIEGILNKPVYEFDKEGFKQWLDNLDFTEDSTYDDLTYRMADKLSTGIIVVPEEYQHGVYVNCLGGSFDVDEFNAYKEDASKRDISLVLHQFKDKDVTLGVTDRYDHLVTGSLCNFNFETPDVSNIDLRSVVLSTFSPARRMLIEERETEVSKSETPQISANALMFK